MTEAQRFSQEEIQPLPRWARLAFAARCVRRAAALLGGSVEQSRVIDRALALVEEASRRGQAGDRLADAAAAAYTLALNEVDFSPHRLGSSDAADEDDGLIVTCTVAHAAAFAAEAATVAVARMASFLVSQSVDFAIQAHVVACPGKVAEVMASMRSDLEHLQEAVAQEGWGNLSAVPANFFEAS
jgi:hypothetical protein